MKKMKKKLQKENPQGPEADGGLGVDIEEIVKEAFRSSRSTLKTVAGYAIRKSLNPNTSEAEKESVGNLIGYTEAAAYLIQKHYEGFLR